MKRSVLFILGLAVLSTGTLVAQNSSPFLAQFNEPGQVNLSLAAGAGYWGIEFGAGAEFIIGAFDLPSFPMEWGVAVRGIVGVPLWLAGIGAGIDWAAAPMATLHKGISLGPDLNFDVYVGLGVGVYGATNSYFDNPVHVGFATMDGIAWQLSPDFYLTLDYAYIGWTSIASLGVRFSL